MQNLESLLLQNRQLTEEVKRRIDQLAAINTVAATVSQSLDLDYTLAIALKAVLNVVDAEAAGISLIDEEAGEVVLRAQEGWTSDFVSRPMRIPLGKGMSGQVIASDDVIVDNDLDGTEELAVPSFHEEHFRSIAMAPMHARGKIIGILSIMSYEPDRFGDEVIAVLKAVADTVGVALDNSRLYEAMAEQEHRLRAIFDSTAEGMIATDQQGRISLINHAAAQLFDLEPQALIGVPLREAPLNPRVRESLLFALSSRREQVKAFQITLESGLSLSFFVSPVYIASQVNQGHYADGWVIVVHDITHLREAELQRVHFMQAAAHDMRNPVSVALSSLNMLSTFFDTDPQAVEIIEIANRGINRLHDLIDDMLNLEQISNGYGVNKTTTDLGLLIAEAVEELQTVLAEKQITCVLAISPDLPPVEADARWIKRALFNYLDNAAKFSPSGAQITVRAFVARPLLHVEVTDSGPGISPESQAHLFERFYRAIETEQIRGTGLGLAIVKSVAEAHGGGVYVHSQPGQGSTFGFTLHLGG